MASVMPITQGAFSLRHGPGSAVPGGKIRFSFAHAHAARLGGGATNLDRLRIRFISRDSGGKVFSNSSVFIFE